MVCDPETELSISRWIQPSPSRFLQPRDVLFTLSIEPPIVAIDREVSSTTDSCRRDSEAMARPVRSRLSVAFDTARMFSRTCETSPFRLPAMLLNEWARTPISSRLAASTATERSPRTKLAKGLPDGSKRQAERTSRSAPSAARVSSAASSSLKVSAGAVWIPRISAIVSTRVARARLSVITS
jgi:hypothetical protein